ncbi:MAG: membrane integrity-associated transporter subunit PqiC [Rhodospirillaceae bacterium]|nr:membrane integrity-associated transporter subunit PqiC [Rhodospirillales bacterium]
MRLGTLGVFLAALALTACAQPAPPRDNFYRLTIATPVQPFPKPVLPGVLEVNRLDTDGALSERGLAYQEADGALARYAYDLWSDAPATAIQQNLAEYLRAAHAADEVVTPDLRVPPDWALRGRLSRFEYLPAQSKVAVKLQLSVVSARDGTLVLLRSYAADTPVQGAGPEAAVAAFNRAMSETLSRFAADLAQTPVQNRHP